MANELKIFIGIVFIAVSIVLTIIAPGFCHVDYCFHWGSWIAGFGSCVLIIIGIILICDSNEKTK